MNSGGGRRDHVRWFGLWPSLLMAAALLGSVSGVTASTYVVYIPLNSSIYDELESLNGLGYLDTYIEEIKPISRVEAARLTLEAEDNLTDSGHNEPLAKTLIRTLKDQLADEVGWLENQAEDDQPTMIRPFQRLQAQYVFSRGQQREWRTGGNFGINATEQTPLFPYNDALPTAPGSNEILRWSGWGGAGGFLTAYGEGAVAGPFTRSVPGVSRTHMLGSAVVASMGNVALSFGTEEMWWGVGHFGALSQSNNAAPFPAVRLQNIHPTLLPWIFRYLGPFRYQFFFGQLDNDRYFSRPWIDGQIFSFKPLPTFEFGFTHTIAFGGSNNDDYTTMGFLGRATGFNTGSAQNGNTNSRGGVYLKFYLPSLRGAQVYQEILGEDNLTDEVPGVGRFLPFLAVSYQGGFYLPRLTADGLTDLRFEYAIIEPQYSVHEDSLYWTYEGQLMGDALGPNATQVDLKLGRWVNRKLKISADAFYTEQAPTYDTNAAYPFQIYPYPMTKEHSGGIGFEMLRLAQKVAKPVDGLADTRARVAIEYAQDLNYQPAASEVRILLMISGSLSTAFGSWSWN